MRSTIVVPCATKPAITRLADARKSVAMTTAPESVSTPWVIAVLPSISMLAPKRFISCTCMKRFSKIVSVTRDVPFAIALTAMNCACMSVAKPGYSVVRMSTGFGRSSILARIQSAPTSNCTPISRSLSKVACMISGSTWVRRISPPVAATAHKNVPASMRSDTTLCDTLCKRSTPSITSRCVPMPEIFAPISTSMFAKSVTSGSHAAFSNTVCPSAKTAAISKFSVPVTVIMSVVMRAPPLSRPPAPYSPVSPIGACAWM